MKRLMDLLLGAAVALGTAPLIAIIALTVRIKLGSPVIFKQVRPGLDEQPFEMFKFRTMVDLFDDLGQPLSDKDRLTSVGAFLRRTSLDELPELANVLKGQMSLVGPRPLLVRYTPFMTSQERRRYQVRPGITGWAQVNGRNNTPWDERLALDVWYVDHQSLRLDLIIILRTIAAVLSTRNVHVDAESVMQNLDDERQAR